MFSLQSLNLFKGYAYRAFPKIIEVAEEQTSEKESVVDESLEEKAKKFGYIADAGITPSTYLESLHQYIADLDENGLLPLELRVTYLPSIFTIVPKLDVENTLVKIKAFSVSRVIYLFYCSFENQEDSYYFNNYVLKCLVECLQVISESINEPTVTFDFSKIGAIETTREGKLKCFLGQLLGCAVVNGNLPVTRLLLQFDLDLNQVNFFEEEIPFVIAARRNRLDLIEFIVEKCVKTKHPIAIATIERALKQAIAKGFVDMAKYLTQLLLKQSES